MDTFAFVVTSGPAAATSYYQMQQAAFSGEPVEVVGGVAK